MSRYEFHDTRGGIRDVVCPLEQDDLRALLSEFKTHCAVTGGAYEFNHFKNWLAKNSGVEISNYSPDLEIKRVDM